MSRLLGSLLELLPNQMVGEKGLKLLSVVRLMVTTRIDVFLWPED